MILKHRSGFVEVYILGDISLAIGDYESVLKSLLASICLVFQYQVIL